MSSTQCIHRYLCNRSPFKKGDQCPEPATHYGMCYVHHSNFKQREQRKRQQGASGTVAAPVEAPPAPQKQILRIKRSLLNQLVASQHSDTESEDDLDDLPMPPRKRWRNSAEVPSVAESASVPTEAASSAAASPAAASPAAASPAAASASSASSSGGSALQRLYRQYANQRNDQIINVGVSQPTPLGGEAGRRLYEQFVQARERAGNTAKSASSASSSASSKSSSSASSKSSSAASSTKSSSAAASTSAAASSAVGQSNITEPVNHSFYVAERNAFQQEINALRDINERTKSYLSRAKNFYENEYVPLREGYNALEHAYKTLLGKVSQVQQLFDTPK